MADNTTLNPGTGGNQIASDEIAGVHHQRVKVQYGADGSATDVSPSAPLPVVESDAELGNSGGMTALRDRLFAQRCTVIGDSLADGINAFWTQTAANGGTVTSAVGEGQVKTSTATNGSMQIMSPLVPYLPGQVAWFNSAIRFGDTGVAGNIRRIGKFTTTGTTPQDGFYFELNGTTLNAVIVKAGSVTAVDSTAWSRVALAPFTLDANYVSFEIRYTANSVWFYVNNVLRHVVSGTSTPLTTTLTLPITIQNIKTSGGTDITFGIRNVGCGRFGEPAGSVMETGTAALNAIAVGGGTPHDSVDTGNPLKMGGRAQATAPTAVADGDRVNAWMTPNGALNVSDSPQTSGGLTVFHLMSAGSTNATNIKNAAGQVYGWFIYNSNASARKVAFHNNSGAPTAGASVFFSLMIPPTSGANVSFEKGIAFSSGIAISTVTGLADSDTAAVAANDLNINIFYK